MGGGSAGHQPETRGLNFYSADRSLRGLLELYAPADQLAHATPHLERLGALVGAHLDDLAATVDRHPPALVQRDRHGRDRQRIECHPAYREMEALAFGELELAALSHRPALGWPTPLHPAIKYAFTYLFSQSEFGLMCPVSMTDSLTRTVRRFAAPALLERYLPALLEHDLERLHQGAMFITEQGAGSDVGAVTTRAEPQDDHWRLYGDKWFCSNADADLALVLARPEGAEPGIRGLALFLMPRLLADGEHNAYRIVRLKDKLGTRSMPSGEIRLDGAVAHLVGEPDQGFVQMAEMINQSRLSNAVRSAGMMRRACHEALAVAHGREAFGSVLADMPLMRRQLAKLLLATESALSMVLFTAHVLARADAGEEAAARVLRVLTPLVKFRICRDARRVTGDAMEVRGGCGYIEEWIEPRLLRDSHLGSIWEGTSNIIALDVLRAARKQRAHEAAGEMMRARMDALDALPGELAGLLARRLAGAVALVGEAAASEGGEVLARQAASALYHAVAAVLLACEGVELAARSGDARRCLWSVAVIEEKLGARDPLAAGDRAAERELTQAILSPDPIPLERASALIRRSCSSAVPG
ncbi:MAG: acyl-CoA dehydrogenase family protein [Gammaproteobacteria bacterium]|nr:acyl-CoA dehydrogenase family protein [Gammaproteobacteria bacterium]